MATHTPGPDSVSAYIEAHGLKTKTAEEIIGHFEAKRRIEAAAPELLAVLKRLLAGHGLVPSAIEEVRAAVAKAEGR